MTAVPERPHEPRSDVSGGGPYQRPVKPRKPRPPRASATTKNGGTAHALPPKPTISAAAAAALPPRPPLPGEVDEKRDVVDRAAESAALKAEEVSMEDAAEAVAQEDAAEAVAEEAAAEDAVAHESVDVADRTAAPDVTEPEAVVSASVAAEPADREPEAAEPSIDQLDPVSPAVMAEVIEQLVEDAEAPASAAPQAVVVSGLTKAFGQTTAVAGIDLSIPAGSFYGLVGPNGAGKTTTLSMIAGLIRPTSGSVRIDGVDAIAHPQQAKRRLGVLPDRLRTFDRLTGRQLLYYCGVLRELSPAVAESRTADLARAFDLTDALSRPVSDYSAGMTKKILLAGALIHSPRVLVLDEPFESVDPVSSAVILDILETYVAHGGTVLLSSHGMQLVERVCSRVAILVAGNVLAEGTIAEVRGESTLEERFLQLAGGLSDVEGLEWLHTFSD
ncbi:ABC transporter ATP-binding protein [Microbacterium sp. ASV49]|uniref:ATP-binding cassette domain-containing protein n=1 Tax=Microbacterium candidum TaxID=3041922 RepID=A0ABT7N2H8_9MICO|nr:ATP-binding cassette domain-containing protein [Microbacterium sp. ASV49]MDL9980909.1 ATP-binding cassette domain-containing protein [Microbacterium sp. ASV49]